MDLSFPDIAGEEFEEQWSTRVWNERYLEEIEQSSGILLFVNARNLRKPFSLADADKVKRSVLALLDDEENAEENSVTHEAVNSGEAIARQVSSQAIEAEEGASNPAVFRLHQSSVADRLRRLVSGRKVQSMCSGEFSSPQNRSRASLLRTRMQSQDGRKHGESVDHAG